MTASMRGHSGHNRMDDRRTARRAIAAAFADEQDWLDAESGEEHVGLKKLGRPQTYMPQYHGSHANDDQSFVSLTDHYSWYLGKVCICGCAAEMHEYGSRICMDPMCDCTDFEVAEESVDYGMLSRELGSLFGMEDWELLPVRRRDDAEPDLGELYERARREDGDRPDVTTFLARYRSGAYE